MGRRAQRSSQLGLSGSGGMHWVLLQLCVYCGSWCGGGSPGASVRWGCCGLRGVVIPCPVRGVARALAAGTLRARLGSRL